MRTFKLKVSVTIEYMETYLNSDYYNNSAIVDVFPWQRLFQDFTLEGQAPSAKIQEGDESTPCPLPNVEINPGVTRLLDILVFREFLEGWFS